MRELRYIQNPNRMRIIWIAVYFIIAAAAIIGLLLAGSKIRTHSLPTGELELSVPYSKYLLGEVVTYSLKNNYNSPIYVANACPNEPLAVYRYEANQWVRLHATANSSSCPNQDRQVQVPARGVVNGTFASWKQLFSQPGYYRVVAYVEYYNALPYQDFEVVAAKTGSSTNSQQTNTSSGQSADKPSSSGNSGSSTQSGSSNSTGSKVEQPVTTPVYTQKKSATVSSSGGKITVQYDSTTVYVTSIAPDQGCSYEGGKSGTEVEVTYKCPGGEYQVQLWVQNGKLQAKYESDD